MELGLLTMKYPSARIMWTSLIAGLTLVVNSAFGAEPASPAKTGLEVGKKAPEWSLNDQHGKTQTLSSYLKKGPVALVFYRSADW